MSPQPPTNIRASRPAILLLAWGLAALPVAVHAGGVLDPPSGATRILSARATGTQDYACSTAPGAGRTAWTFVAPQAFLRDQASGPDVAEHYLGIVPGRATTPGPACTEAAGGTTQLCPTWRSPVDGSAVWGEKSASLAAGSGPACPNAGGVPCLLVKVIASTTGRGASGLARARYIQRLDTRGGAAPAAACTAGEIALVPYTATYVFYAAP